LNTAFEVGISHFDTSPYYGYGLAEHDLGRFIRGCRARVTVATKVGLYAPGRSSSHVASVWIRKAAGRIFPPLSLPTVDFQTKKAQQSLQESLKRLGTDYVDFLFLHEPYLALVNTDEMLGWLESCRNKGVILAWGVAGIAEQIAAWVETRNPLAAVVQTKDSLDLKEADFVLQAGRALQFTYGYLSRALAFDPPEVATVVVRRALLRNATGTVLVSTRKMQHLFALARAVS